MAFCHLHLHSEFSSMDGMGRVESIVAKAKELQFSHIAITDHGVNNSWPLFFKEAKKAGITPIFGVEGYMCNDMRKKGLDEETRKDVRRGLKGAEANKAIREAESDLELSKRAHIVILAKNENGAEEINRAISDANEYGFYYRPRLDFERLSKMKDVVICSACTGGIINYYINRGYLNKAEKEALKYREVFGNDFYLEMQAIDWPQQTEANLALAKLIMKHKFKFIITNDCHYVDQEDWKTHDCLMAIQSSHKNKTVSIHDTKNRMHYEMHDLYIKSEDQMRKSFLNRNPRLRKFEKEGIARTMEIAKKCSTGKIHTGFKIMPDLKIDNEYKYLKDRVIEGWNKKIRYKIPKEKHFEYQLRVREELEQIRKQGFVKYFIIVYKLMKFCEESGIERGPARGSSAGSLVCYLLDITKSVDPIKWNLLFSRFIDPNRTDNPDIDMDFQDDRRYEVMDYLEREYGKYNVALLSNNMRFKGKMTLKDVSRVYGISATEVNEITSLILSRSSADSRASFTILDSFNEFEKCKQFKEKYPDVVDHSAKLEGIVKLYGTHAAGTVIGDGDLRKYASIRWDRSKDREVRLINVDKRDIEDLGLLKLDLLGLNTLTIIKECKNLIKERHDIDIDLENLEFNDKRIFKEFAAGNCMGIFQFENPGLIRLSQAVKIENFDEVMAVTALHRPGPLHGGQAARYPMRKINRKAGKDENVNKAMDHPIINELTKDTYGEILYQEQIMMIVRKLGGFDWHDTNDIRKCMSHSGGAEYFYRNYWEKFRDGCAKHDIKEGRANEIFKRMMTFGSWSFNLSHAASYGAVSYQCMWLKIYYPIEYLTAYLNKTTDEKAIPKIVGEIRRMGIEIEEPDINNSGVKFIIKNEKIFCGLSNIKHVGENAIKEIINNQPYSDLIDFMKKVEKRKVNSRTIKSLLMAGCFRYLHKNTKTILELFDKLNKTMSKKKASAEEEARGILDAADGGLGEDFDEFEKISVRSSVTPVSVGKHACTFYHDFCKKFGKHIKLTKLIDYPMDPTAKRFGGSYNSNLINTYSIGILRSIDLKRISQEVKYIVASEDEFRYAICDFQDETDYSMLSLQSKQYKKYEDKLWDIKGKVVLVQGYFIYGVKKIYVIKMWVMDELMEAYENGTWKNDSEIRYLFRHPMNRIPNNTYEKICTKYRVDKPYRIESKLEGEWARVFGVITGFSGVAVRKKDSKYVGKIMYNFEINDGENGYSFYVMPWINHYDNIVKACVRYISNETPVIMPLKIGSIAGDKTIGSNIKRINFDINYKASAKDLFIKTFKFKKH